MMKNMAKEEIISKLPYSKPFLFVGELLHIDENGVEGTYTFDENLDFYKGHLKENPVTPGVILTEVMAYPSKEERRILRIAFPMVTP